MKKTLYQNALSRFAGVMAVMVFVITAILLLLDYLGVKLAPVIGVLTYTLFPGLLFFYLLLIPVGMYREWRRRQKKKEVEPLKFPKFDFNVRSQRIQLYIFILGTSLVGLLVLMISFRAYEFTESVYFCSQICHRVMEPEATTYVGSPHARVPCVQCHVGKGATWYVKSKLAGLYQVYATLFDEYPRPIKTPIENLRPSADTCEQCHWPSKFYGARQVLRTHYQEDEKNTPREFFMLLNIGGGVSPTGIHWHVGEDQVHYIPRDESRQDIPWVSVRYKDGREIIYTDSQNPPDPKTMAVVRPRRMDCMDCHNRPTHIFRSPRQAIDEEIQAGRINRSLPYVKKLGVELLSKDYAAQETAKASIRDGVYSYYREKYPEIFTKRGEEIEETAGQLAKIWLANNFTQMKSKWSFYPNNAGHLIWPGCFRCHDGQHKSQSGETIKKECNICHLFLSESLSGVMTAETALGKPFIHPVDVGGAELASNCNTCHGSF